MSNIILYAQLLSPPSRAVLMAAHAIGLNLKLHETNLFRMDNLTKEYTKLNPEQLIPTLDDNGFILTDSHAINCYIVDKYSKDQSLYPKDLQKRALIHKFLHFDSGSLFPAGKNIIKPVLSRKTKTISEEQLAKLKESVNLLNTLLEDKKWLVGDSYTLADISCITSAVFVPMLLDIEQYPNVKNWLQRCEEELPGFKEYNAPGNEELKAAIQALLKKE